MPRVILANRLLEILSQVIKCAAAVYNIGNQGAGIINIKSTNSPITLPAAIAIKLNIVSSFTKTRDTLLTKNGRFNTAETKKQKENAIAPPIPPSQKIKPNTPSPNTLPA